MISLHEYFYATRLAGKSEELHESCGVKSSNELVKSMMSDFAMCTRVVTETSKQNMLKFQSRN
jgi:hypothetical protein